MLNGKETEYALEKAKFNALYGMTVTNNIRDLVIFDNKSWQEIKLTNNEIKELLDKQKEERFFVLFLGCMGYCICKI